MNRLVACLSVAVAASALACGDDPETFSGPVADGGNVGGPDSGVEAGTSNPEAGTVQPTPCVPGGSVDADADGDGFSPAQGDCNDCDKLINPGAYDFPGDAHDEDCDGTPAPAEQAECDTGLDIGSSAAQDAARAIGLCKFTTADKRDWGVIEARFTTANGTGSLDDPMQVGLVPNFGNVQPRSGSTLLALSSGVARAPDQSGYTPSYTDAFSGSAQTPPNGFPKASSVCPSNLFSDAASRRVFNQAALELKIRVPTNAHSLSFDSIFYSYEYPDYICQPFNDFYVALLEPAVSPDGNIVFDANSDPIGVNTGLLAVCNPDIQLSESPKKFDCEQGQSLLTGTGFGPGEYQVPGLFGSSPGMGGASTGWLTTIAPSAAGTIITLRFAIWDTGDAKVDSTVLVDRFQWSVDKPTGAVTSPTPVLL